MPETRRKPWPASGAPGRPLPEAVVTVVDDSAAPGAPGGQRALVRCMGRGIAGVLPRCGNLRGPECVRGIIATLAGGAADGDTVVKIDSDTALLSGGWVRDMQHNGLALHASGYRVPRNPSERSAYGNCYALSGRDGQDGRRSSGMRRYPPARPGRPNHLPGRHGRLRPGACPA